MHRKYLSSVAKQPLIALVAFAGFSLSMFFHMATFFCAQFVQSTLLNGLLHFGILPIFFYYVIRSQKYDRRRAMKLLLQPLPPLGRIMIYILFAYIIVNFVLFIYLSEGGSPEVQDGTYILRSHGTLIRELTEKEYKWQLMYRLRGFSGHWMLFYLIPALYFWRPNDMTTQTEFDY